MDLILKMSILEKLQKEYNNMKNCEAGVELDRDETLSDGEKTDKNLMSPPKVGQEKLGDVNAGELLQQFMKAQEDTHRKLEESLAMKLNEFRTETNEKFENNLRKYTQSDNNEPVTKKQKLDEGKKGDRTDSRPWTESEDDKSESRPSTSNFYNRLSEKFVEVEKTGPKVEEKLANIITVMLKAKLSDKKRIELLVVPKINNEIWSIMYQSKQKDITVQKMQKTLITALVPVINVVEKLVSADQKNQNLDTDEIVTDLMDAVSLMANVSQEISYRRRESIRQDIGEKYTELWSRQTPITGKLFGDDVDEEIKRIDKTKNLDKKPGCIQQRRQQVFFRIRLPKIQSKMEKQGETPKEENLPNAPIHMGEVATTTITINKFGEFIC